MKKIIFIITMVIMLCTIDIAKADQETARELRYKACEEMYWENYQHMLSTYKLDREEHDPISRCATYMHLVYIMESWTGKSNFCRIRNNCHGIEAVGREGMGNWLTDKDTKWKKNNLLFEMQFNQQWI